MNYRSLMNESLTDLLSDGEKLMYPIYGMLDQGNKQYYGFFGFTDNFLLIALVSGDHITYTSRIPLNIRSVKIEQSGILKQYTIDINFKSGAPCKIIASPRVMMINTQKDTLPLFLDFLKDRSPEEIKIKFCDNDGQKIRFQYFSVFLYIMLAFLPMPLIMIGIFDLKAGNFSWLSIAEGIIVYLKILLPFFALALLNRFFFGKILCTVNEKGLFTGSDLILWEDIKEAEYRPEIPAKRQTEYTSLSLTVNKRGDEKYSLCINHFPLYGLVSIKKYAPKIKIKVPSGKIWAIVIMMLLPSVCGLIMALIF